MHSPWCCQGRAPEPEPDLSDLKSSLFSKKKPDDGGAGRGRGGAPAFSPAIAADHDNEDSGRAALFSTASKLPTTTGPCKKSASGGGAVVAAGATTPDGGSRSTRALAVEDELDEDEARAALFGGGGQSKGKGGSAAQSLTAQVEGS
jgi:hypothetical protein